MAFSPEDIFLALGGATGTIRIINVKKCNLFKKSNQIAYN